MKFLHTADLHIGKIVNDFSMLDDQRFILEQIRRLAVRHKVDGVLIAGDIYDRAIPTGDAVLLLDAFLTGLVKAGIWVFMISGNHDSAERLSFGEEMLAKQKIGIGAVYNGQLSSYVVEKGDEAVEVVLLPFVKPAQVDARTSGEAVEKILQTYDKNANGIPKILVTHYFVTDAGREPELSDGETTVHVGGLDNVEASLLDGFDYVALGHIHKPQQIYARSMYYAGAPLKYSFGEGDGDKSVCLVEIGKEGLVKTEQISLHPYREFRKVKGTLQEIMERGALERSAREDYIQAILTDKEELIDPIGTLRSIYPNVMQIVREEKREQEAGISGNLVIGKKEPITLFEEFYEVVREEKISEEEKQIITDVVKGL